MSEQKEMKKDFGIYLEEPFVSWIRNGIASLLVTTEPIAPEHLGKEIGLVNDKIYGSISLKFENEASLTQFAELREKHRIDEPTRQDMVKQDTRWNTGPFYIYSFAFKAFDAPKDYEIAKSTLDTLHYIIKETPIPSVTKTVDTRMVASTDPIKPSDVSITPSAEATQPISAPQIQTPTEPIVKVDDNLILKPKGPWGEGFKECESYVRSHYPKIKDPAKYCGKIYWEQKKSDDAVGWKILERPTGYDILFDHQVEGYTDGPIIKDGDFNLHTIQFAEGDMVQTKIAKITVSKPYCPCKLKDTDFTKYAKYYDISVSNLHKLLIK